jgi:hypothetical protein
MARFAKIGLNSKVIDVIELNDMYCTDANNNFDENLGVQWLSQKTGWALWKACTDSNFGNKNCGIGSTYDEDNNVFKNFCSFSSWTFNLTTGNWDSPVPYPSAELEVKYKWNEQNRVWELL